MPWDSDGTSFTRDNGTQTGPTTWDDADAAGNNITTSQHDTHDEDLAQGIQACVNADRLANTASTAKGDALIGVKRTDTGASATTLHAWIERQVLSVCDFMSAAQIADVRAGTLAEDVAAEIKAAADALSTNAALYFPRGKYYINDGSLTNNAVIYVSSGTKDAITIYGDGNASEINFGTSCLAGDAFIRFDGASGDRGIRNAVRGLSFQGQAATTDMIPIKADFQTNLVISDFHANGLGGRALNIDACWDVRLLNSRIYGCGARDGTGEAVYIHSDSSGAGSDNTNFVSMSDVTIERSFGKTLHIKSMSGLLASNIKLHGRASTESNSSDSKELLYVNACTLVHVNGYQFAQCRVPSGSGAVRITGGQSMVILNDGHFINIDDAANKHDIYIDSSNTSTRLYLDNTAFRDTRATAQHIYLGSQLGQEPLWLGANVEMTSGLELSDQRTNPFCGYHLNQLPSVRLKEYTAVPLNNLDLDGGVHVLDFEATGNAVANDLIGYRASGAVTYAGLMEWSFGWDGTVTSANAIAAKRFPIATNLSVNILQVDILCGTAPTENFSGGAYWYLRIGNGSTQFDVVLDPNATPSANVYAPTKTALTGATHYRALITSPISWGSGSLIRASLVKVGAPGTDPANVHVSCTYKILR